MDRESLVSKNMKLIMKVADKYAERNTPEHIRFSQAISDGMIEGLKFAQSILNEKAREVKEV